VVRRIIDTTGIDVELASSVSPAAAARRDNLDLFVKAVAEFQAVDGDVTLPALLAYLTAEDDQGNGLDVATPTEADSVKLLTVHRAKGLEWASSSWSASARPGSRPTARARCGPPRRRSCPAPLRGDAADLPQLAAYDKAGLDAYREATRAHDAEEELRLGYVAFTRAAHRLVVSSYLWSKRDDRSGPRPTSRRARVRSRPGGLRRSTGWSSPRRARQPATPSWTPVRPWPVDRVGREASCGSRRPPSWSVDPSAADAGARHGRGRRGGVGRRARAPAGRGSPGARHGDRGAAALVAVRDLAGAAARRPGHLCPRAGPADAAPAVARGPVRHPLPRLGRGAVRPAAADRPRRAARCRADAEIDEDELRELVAAFEAGQFADRVPHAVEPPFALVLDGQVVRGRIDAVYAEPTPRRDDRFLVVDWKTNRPRTPTRSSSWRSTGSPGPSSPACCRRRRSAGRAGAGGVPLRADGPDGRAARRPARTMEGR
jgi:DNA helicase-2/ATP-dependent DNA helicase PcrA